MEHLFEFALVVIAISASGVMAPGPLFAANVSYGLKGGTKTGIQMATGHAAVELPLVILLGAGALSLEMFPEFRSWISGLGALSLFGFAGLQIISVLKNKEEGFLKFKSNPVITGAILSALNPFFVVWWLTIGLKMISDAMEIWSFGGILVMFVLHVWMDFVWLGVIAFFASKSSKLLSNRNYRVMIILLSIILVYFGIMFLLDMAH